MEERGDTVKAIGIVIILIIAGAFIVSVTSKIIYLEKIVYDLRERVQIMEGVIVDGGL